MRALWLAHDKGPVVYTCFGVIIMRAMRLAYVRGACGLHYYVRGYSEGPMAWIL
jgi:hypothetical protein